MTATLTSPAELEEFLLDKTKVDAAASDGTLYPLLKDSAHLINERDKTLDQQLEIEKQRVEAELRREHGEKTPVDLTREAITAAIKANSRRITVQNNGQTLSVPDPRAVQGPGAEANGLAASADIMAAIGISAREKGRSLSAEQSTMLRKLQEVRNSYGSTVPADGGFLIPDEVRQEILMIALESAVVRPRATVIPMSSLRLKFPAVDVTTNNGSLYGGVIAYWAEEAASLTESQASFEAIQLDAKKLTAFAAVPNELLDDAPAFQMFLDQSMPTALAWYEDIGFISGTGTGEPLGFLNAPAMVSVAKQVGQAASTILWENVVGMYARMLPSSQGRAVWLASPDTFPELATMALSVGTGGSAVWLNNGAAGPPMTILGRPVIFTEKVKGLTNQGDINFVDLSYYLIGDRQAMQAAASDQYLFQNDKMAFRLIERVDGRPWIQSAITPQNSSATLSPFVNLAAR